MNGGFAVSDIWCRDGGGLGFAIGAMALVLTIVLFWAGPFAPQQAATVTLGEMAAEIAKSAARSAAGQAQPAPEVIPRTVDDYLEIAVAVLAGFAIILGLAAFIRREDRRTAFSALALGILAIGFQLFTWTVMMIVGAIVIFGIMASLSETFGDLFGE